MISPDFNQTAEDHASLLVLVQQLGNDIKPKLFQKIFDRLALLDTFSIAKPARKISFKYRKSYSRIENSWGSFQAHRKVLGLITIGQCGNKVATESESKENYDFEKFLIKEHQSVKDQYEDTLLDSILILFKSEQSSDNSPNSEAESTDEHDETLTMNDIKQNGSNLETPNTNNQHGSDVSSPTLVNNIKLNPDGTCFFSLNSDINSNANENFNNADKFKQNNHLNDCMHDTHIWRYKDIMACTDLEVKMQDFFNSLFWVLESKRLDRSHERLDHLVLYMAPFEKKDSGIFLDIESRSYKKKCIGRYRKHLGDLCLLAGLPGEATLHYQTCLELLKASNDWMWIAGAQEGLAISSYLILKPRPHQLNPMSQSMARNLSFSVRRGVVKNKDSKYSQMIQSEVSSLQSGLDLANDRSKLAQHPLENMHEDILINYKDAVINYCKIKEAGLIELEASLKACRILSMYKRVIEAADFLQNVIRINITIAEQDKIEQFSTLSSLYDGLGLKRKSSFYSRIAAMLCVVPVNPQPSWHLCYRLLLQSFPGFKLSLDPRDLSSDLPDQPDGWPSLKLRVFHELIYAARKLGDPAVPVRHLCLLLHTMFQHLSMQERVELCHALKSYTDSYRPSPYSMALQNGTILPPVAMTLIPVLRNVEILDLVPLYRPSKFKRSKLNSSGVMVRDDADSKPAHPFIYSPFMDASNQNWKNQKYKQSHAQPYRDVTWVNGNSCEIELYFSNLLPIDLLVEHVDILFEGAEVKVHPVTFTLPPFADLVKVRILVDPVSAGQAAVIGYTAEVFKVKSIIKFKDLLHSPRPRHPPPHARFLPPPPPLTTTTTTSASSTSLTSLSSLSVNKSFRHIIKRFKIHEKYDVTVIPSMPLLQITSSSLPSLSSPTILTSDLSLTTSSTTTTPTTITNKTDVVDDCCIQLSTDVVIYCGQRSDLILTLLNIGKLPVERLDVLVTAQPVNKEFLDSIFQQKHLSNAINSSEDYTSGKLPLASGDKLDITFHIIGPNHFKSEGGSTSYLTDMLSDSERLLKYYERFLNANNSLTCTVTILLQYNGGPCAEYCRQCSMVLTTTILPSLEILQHQVLPHRRLGVGAGCGKMAEDVVNNGAGITYDNCSLEKDVVVVGLELKNSSENSIEISSSVPGASDVYNIEPYQVVWLHVSIPKFENDPSLTRSDANIVNFDLRDHRASTYRNMLVEHVDRHTSLSWKMPNIETEGHMTLSAVHWSKEQCMMLQRSFLSSCVTVNDKKVESHSSFVCEAFMEVHVSVRVANKSDMDLSNVCVTISLVDENNNPAPHDTFLLIGSSDVSQSKMQVNAVLEHNVTILPVVSARRKLRILCSASTDHSNFQHYNQHFKIESHAMPASNHHERFEENYYAPKPAAHNSIPATLITQPTPITPTIPCALTTTPTNTQAKHEVANVENDQQLNVPTKTLLQLSQSNLDSGKSKLKAKRRASNASHASVTSLDSRTFIDKFHAARTLPQSKSFTSLNSDGKSLLNKSQPRLLDIATGATRLTASRDDVNTPYTGSISKFRSHENLKMRMSRSISPILHEKCRSLSRDCIATESFSLKCHQPPSLTLTDASTAENDDNTLLTWSYEALLTSKQPPSD